MGPDHVGEVGGKEGVLVGDQPVSHRHPPVLALEVGSFPAKELRLHDPIAYRVAHLATARVEHDGLARVLGALPANLGEEGGEAVVIILGPAIEGVVVTLGALDPHPHEDLGDVFGHLQGVGLVLVVVGGWIFEGAAAGAKQLAHHLVHRDIVGDLVLQPVVVQQHRLVAHLVGRPDLQQLSPFHHPELDELFAAEELIDELRALVFFLVRGEARVFFGGGKQADDVEVGTAQKDLVGAELRRGDPQLAELFVDQGVDIVVLDDLRRLELKVLGQDDEVAADGEGVEARHDKGLSPGARAHDAFLGDLCRGVVVGQEVGQPGYIPGAAIGIFRPDRQLLGRTLSIEDGTGGVEFDPGRMRDAGGVARSPGLQPAHQRSIQLGVFLEPFPSRMADPAGALLEQQAVVYQREVEPAAVELSCQAVVVAIRVVAEEREHEAIFSAGRAMAASGIAAGLHEDGHDIELEADRPVDGGVLDRDRQRDGLSGQRDSELGGAIFNRQHGTALDLRQGRVRKAVFRLGGDVPGQAV